MNKKLKMPKEFKKLFFQPVQYRFSNEIKRRRPDNAKRAQIKFENKIFPRHNFLIVF